MLHTWRHIVFIFDGMVVNKGEMIKITLNKNYNVWPTLIDLHIILRELFNFFEIYKYRTKSIIKCSQLRRWKGKQNHWNHQHWVYINFILNVGRSQLLEEQKQTSKPNNSWSYRLRKWVCNRETKESFLKAKDKRPMNTNSKKQGNPNLLINLITLS